MRALCPRSCPAVLGCHGQEGGPWWPHKGLDELSAAQALAVLDST